MKHLKSYKIFESDGPLEPCKWSWTKDLTIPRDIQMDIYDMAFELKDEGYTVSYQWWPPYEQGNKLYKDNKYPSINITKRDTNDEFAWEKISYAWIKDFCERVSSYLDDKDYNVVVKFRKVNTNDYYDINKSYPNQEPFSDHHMATSIHFRIEMISRRVYGDVYESVHDTKEEIEEIVSTCKDILLEANDTFSGNSLVDKVYKDNEVVITCFYTVPFNIKARSEEYKSTMDDIHGRLIEYMTSQGFTYNNRGDRYTAYFDMMVGNITYNIVFSKELDKEFIGHLRYLKKYNLLKESVGEDLSDILLEINDELLWKAECWSDSQEGKWVVVIQTVDDDEEYELEGQTPLPIVIESIERAIDFMNKEGFTNYQITFENTDDIYKGGSAEFEEITLEDVPGLDVWPNNFIRIEFWK